jgi:signal transduction histidine kinase
MEAKANVMHDPTIQILGSIFDTLPSGMLLMDADGAIIRINQQAKEVLGLEPDIHPTSLSDHFPFYLSPLANLLKKTTQDVQRGEIMLSLPSREEDSILGYSLKHLSTRNNQSIKVLTFSDITQVHRDRLAMDKIKDELNQSKKLASIGTMIAGVAHELNNPLTGISMSASLVKMNLDRLKGRADVQGNPELSQNLDKALQEVLKVSKSTEKASILVSDLLAYSKPTQLVLLPVSLYELMQDTCKALKSHPQFVQFNIAFTEKSAPLVLCDRVKLEQVFFNLFKNACDATDGKGTLTLSFTEETDEHGKPFVVTHVKDNGPGIDKTIINRIFDPFFTTKGHSGVGLGLSLSYRTVEQHGGLLSVDSIKDQGSDFQVRLPIYEPLDPDSETTKAEFP